MILEAKNWFWNVWVLSNRIYLISRIESNLKLWFVATTIKGNLLSSLLSKSLLHLTHLIKINFTKSTNAKSSFPSNYPTYTQRYVMQKQVVQGILSSW